MSVLIISDLHLGDKRNSLAHEKKLLDDLAKFICRKKFQAVLNLGDTVSRKEFLRSGTETLAEFAKYRKWRDALKIPFRECTIYRERPFFESVFDQKPDSVWNGTSGLSIFTMSPDDVYDHQFSAMQWYWFREALIKTEGKAVLIGSHVPYPGSCTRPVTPGIYLEIPEDIQRLLENHPRPVFWAGGHFHWKDDPPLVRGNLTALMGARFAFEQDFERQTYLQQLNLNNFSIYTITNITGEQQ